MLNSLPYFPTVYRGYAIMAQFQLRAAAGRVTSKIEALPQDEQDEFTALMDDAFKADLLGNKAKLNKAVAEANGIEVIDLINSPNMEKLVQEYGSGIMMKGIETSVAWLQEKLDDCTDEDIHLFMYTVIGLDDSIAD